MPAGMLFGTLHALACAGEATENPHGPTEAHSSASRHAFRTMQMEQVTVQD
jgi:hypothetical protein